MGIKEWFAPQISEHCPENIPIRFLWIISWFSRPGDASALTPIEGMVQEWITSADVTSTRIWVFAGINTLSEHFSSRIVVFGSMNISASFSFDGSSWDQYHWCPVAFTVIVASFDSSIR
jgi:hypothetical protein